MTTQPDIICYSNDGLAFRAVPYNYTAQSGEFVFTTIHPPVQATPTQLTNAFPNYPAKIAQKAATDAGYAALANPIILTSASTPSLNASYSIASANVANLNAVVTFIIVNGSFPGGLSAMPWKDVSGVMHTFPNVSLFQEFATAVANYVALVTLYRDSGGESGSLPSNIINIS